MAQNWTEDDITDQSGRTVLVTGANSGLGLRSAEALAAKGAKVLLACRSLERGEKALATVRTASTGGAEPELIRLDLADLGSVRAAAATVRKSTGDGLDVLINNAGLMASPRQRTADGFERQFGTNHLGHAALTWLVMPALRAKPGARVVTLSSVAAYGARLDLADPNFEHRRYNPGSAYGQSKLANQVFALELDRRLREAGADVASVAAHPGYTATSLGSSMASAYRNKALSTVIGLGNRIGELVLAQDAEIGVLPQLYAATAEGVNGGDYVGPRSFGGLRGYPTIVTPLRAALDRKLGSGLWELTARLTEVTPDPA
ncbi:oxidoreductase [Amycolatopsis sp. CA-230715]|uniref:oxidoreductase n=1 Tax=Amycolatopsis sp. CA-230715 TaxID=2745196 RepID=UPI001C02E0DE|nr:oxidoreductase [Amycolatopsis sp. CA-230715]QWF83149.1 hypothetical protein HUW46_06589 [Amycolatopsis sp. CA-230715]